MSPRMLGRTDIDRYGSSVKAAVNMHPVIHGGIKRRGGSRYLLAATAPTTANGSTLIPFVQSQSQAWMIELGNLTMRILNADGTAAGVTLTSPYGVSQAPEVDWAQSDSTLYLFHGSHMPRRLRRLENGAWLLDEAPFSTLPFVELGSYGATDITLSAATVGIGRTATTGVDAFLAADVGRALMWEGGVGLITAVGSATSATLTISQAFNSTTVIGGQWILDSSPQATCTPSAAGPVGATITLTLDIAGWRQLDVQQFGMVRINGGLVRLSAFTSSTIVSGIVVRELTGTVAAPPNAWSLELPAWRVGFGFGCPRTGTVHQQRLICAGTQRFPRTVWGSRVGEPLDFELGTTDDLAFAFTIDGDEASAIKWVSSSSQLMVMTDSGEYSMRSGIESALSSTNVRVVPESAHGSAAVRPVTAGDELMMVQRSRLKVRSIAYRYDFDRFGGPDIIAAAEHLAAPGITGLAYVAEPEQMLWAVRSDGKLLSCTIDRDQQPAVMAWTEHDVSGVVECVQALPAGDRDYLWLIVRRTINGATARTVERLEESWFYGFGDTGKDYGYTVDSGRVFDNGAGQTVFSVPHLIGKEVAIVGDGISLDRQTVPVSGNVTIAVAALRTLIGLPMAPRVTLLNPEFGTGTGTAQAQAQRTAKLALRCLESYGCRVTNGKGADVVVPFRRFGATVLDAPPALLTGWVEVGLLGWSKADDDITLVLDEPYPFHLLALVRSLTVNAGG